MAANMPQMGGPVSHRRPQHQQLSPLVFSQIMNGKPPNPTTGWTGWQANISPNVRVGHAMNIITNSFLAMPQGENSQIVAMGLQYEREAFTQSSDKAMYETRIMARVNELFKKRQANEHNLHNTLNAQAAAQAQAQTQAQMMMNQNMQMRGMGQQPLQQGFQNLQHQMQPSISQQGQPNMGMNNPPGIPMNPNQQAMQMGGQMRPQMSMQTMLANLSPQDRIKVNQVAISKFNATPEPQRNQFRQMVQQRLTPQQLTQLQQENMDPLIYFFQSQVLQTYTSRGQAGANQAGMPMQAQQQRSMNQPVQQLPTGPNGEFGPFANVESIMNQQKAGLIAQEAGQMVVPASNGAVRNATPQPMGALPGPNPGAGQSAVPHQLPQQFNHQPAQQLKMDQRAAQTQAQIRAQAQAKQMQGQPGGLNGPGGVSQSPAMNTLNTPVGRPPTGVGQTEGHPQMGQGIVPFGQQMMDPRFNQMGQRTPMGANGNMNRNTMLNSILAQMPAETRQQIVALPPDKIPEMIMKWNATRGQMAGRPQPQLGQVGPGNPMAQSMAQFAPGNNNIGQQPNLGIPMNQQSQLMMQQQLNKLRNPNTPQGPLDRSALMDSMNVPQKILDQLRMSAPQASLSPDVKKWGQLKQWMVQKNLPQHNVQSLLSIQNAQFQSYVNKNPAFAAVSSQAPQPNLLQQGIHPISQVTPQMGQPTPNMAGSNSGISITPQEFQRARNHENFKGWPDEKVRQVLIQMKMANLKKNQMSGPQAQAPQASQPGHTTTPSTSQPANGTAAPQRHQNTGPETNTASPAIQGRTNKQPQNSRAPPTVPVAPTSKSGIKRRSSDDLAEVPNASSTPVQRHPSQQPQATTSSVPPQIPHLSPEQLATMTSEQRQKYETMVKSRQPATTSQMSEEMMHLKAIAQDEHQAAASEQLPDIPMTPEQQRDIAQKIRQMSGETGKISKILARWYTLVRDDVRARLFFKLRIRLMKQWVDGEKTSMLKDKLSMSLTDLDSLGVLIQSIAKDVASHFPHNMRKNPSQQNVSETAPSQGASTRPRASTAQPAPLNAANLEKQTQALNKMHQRNNSRAGQPPAAPTTAQPPPFPFGAQSPDGQPTYAGKPAVTQDNLQLPARKKPRTGTGPSLNGSSANVSPQVQKLSSPEMSKRQAAAEARQPPAKPQIQCTEQNCEFRSIGFLTEEALHKHMDEEHIKPAEDPMKYFQDNLAGLFSLDANGKMPTVGGNVQSPGDTSKQIQTPTGRAELVNSRESPMRRQGSTTGSKPNELIKTIAGKAGTPKPDSTLVPAASGGAASQMASGEVTGTTIDPQELLFAVTGLEMGGGGAISDMNVYRAITPNDTPESSKDSASSEPNSDVSEGVALNVTLDMGIGGWDPFPGRQYADLDSTNLDLGDVENLPSMAYPDYTWDEVNPDFSKPFSLDTSLFSFDISS
ncbi:hypothetical protein HD806DRAFT_37456 [Xylariaceae sp. AK1471]|nr:hypothetical protein HD806DRAFT_37456 [Xylariaceae sp. AK1471]